MKEFQNFLTNYEDGTVYVTDEVEYNLQDVIKDDFRAYNSKFKDGIDAPYFNMGWILYRTLVYATDIDTKDIITYPRNDKAWLTAKIVRHALQHHLYRTKFGEKLDQIRETMLAFGTCITKIVDGELYIVDLRNVIRPPHIKDIQKSGLAERCYYTYEQLKAHKNEIEDWDAVEKLYETMIENKKYMFTVYEWWTEEEFDGEIRKGCIKYLDNSNAMPDDPKSVEMSNWAPFIELYRFVTPDRKRRETKKQRELYGEYEDLYPYQQATFIEAPGRWKGFGVFELVKPQQKIYNETWDLFIKKNRVSLMGYWKHNMGSNGNSLEQQFLSGTPGMIVELGDNEEFARLDSDSKIGDFQNFVDKIFEVARQLVGVTASSYEAMPSTTTATTASINQQTQKTTYDYVIEQMSHYLVDLFENFYLPIIIDQLDEKDMIVTGTTQEMRELDQIFVENLLNNEVKKFKEKTGMYPTEEEYEAERQRLMSDHTKHGDMRFMNLKKKLIKLADLSVDVSVNNERFDKIARGQMLLNIANNPNYAGDRGKIFDTIMEMEGEDPDRFRTQQPSPAMQAPAMPTPQPMGIPNAPAV